MPGRMIEEGRTLTDKDIEAIVELLKTEIVTDFYGEVGKGIWGTVKKAIIQILLLFAVWSMAHSETVQTAIPQLHK